MKKWSKTAALVLLLINGIGALYGGWNLIIHPDGSSIELSPDWLKTTPFRNYLVPGIILFLCNGVFSLVAVAALLFKTLNYPLFIIAQGKILFGWIIIQILLIQIVYFLHFVMGSVGLALILSGWLCYRNRKETVINS